MVQSASQPMPHWRECVLERPAGSPVQVNIAVMATVKGGKRTLLPLLARAEWHMQHGSIGASAIRHPQPVIRNRSPAAWKTWPPHGGCHRLVTPFLLTNLGFPKHQPFM